jgi:flagellar protein FliO/FliZ
MFQFNGRGKLKYVLILCGLILAASPVVYAQTEASQTEESRIPDATERAQESSRAGEDEFVFSEGEAPEFDLDDGGTSFGPGDMVRMLLVLAAVIGTIYGVFYLLKRASSGKFAPTSFVRIVGTQGLPGNRYLHLVEVGNQIFLIGSGENAVTLVSEITNQETRDEIRLSASQYSAQEKRSFSELLSGMFQSFGETGGASAGPRSETQTGSDQSHTRTTGQEEPDHQPTDRTAVGGRDSGGTGREGHTGSDTGSDTGSRREKGGTGPSGPLEFLSSQRDRLRRLR